MNEKNKEQIQKKYFELQVLQHQLQQVQQQVQAIESQVMEMDVVQSVLDEFGKSKPGSDLFVTLTPGIFVKAKLEKSDSVLVNVGGGAVVQKSVPEGINLIAEQSVELRKLHGDLLEQMHMLTKRAESLQEELQKLVK